MTTVLCVFYLAEGRKAACLVNWYLLLSYFICPLFYVSFTLLKKSMLLGLLAIRIVLFYINIVLCVLYLAENRKFGCLVYWYFVLCYFIGPLFYVSFILLRKGKQLARLIATLYCVISYNHCSMWLFAQGGKDS